ncbi:menaquinone biosynthesis family protein [Helicobacter turcicus]|uniref:1,4-dihydroxy-6-naphtoate synthase n=1 Tax=Helicobacter turcicus TaxID=2867412 RepID=A0ABS7JMN0_9HELI|nr:MqnA/MqnD/SBP family protein [Helicobacter turcicus]MBX7490653.1 S-ribosylhomocysteine lyase [Helicobacter turcicus]MBX7545439.1 S-ribosylhomocysteine lyase [Helicobacter turcicus]
MRTLQIGHSPDADDLFMYYAIAFGWVSHLDIIFQNCALDIQTLNEKALKSALDISAISFSVYPLISKEQCLLRTGVSFGNGYGPKLIKTKGKKLKRNFKVALSGAHTTNAMLFKIAYPDARIVYKNFLEIENAILSGEVDAGVLIHESILQYDENLEVEREIWDIWSELNKQDFPLPLGGMCIRRSLPLSVAITCEELLTKAVRVALENKLLLSKMLLERNLIRVDSKKLEIYLNLYANKDSISLSQTQLNAINALFRIGYDYKIYTQILNVEDCLIPSEYANLRNS